MLRSPNVAPPRRQFQVVGGHNPKTGIALKRQIASRAAHKCAPSLDLASSSDDDTDEGREGRSARLKEHAFTVKGTRRSLKGAVKI